LRTAISTRETDRCAALPVRLGAGFVEILPNGRFGDLVKIHAHGVRFPIPMSWLPWHIVSIDAASRPEDGISMDTTEKLTADEIYAPPQARVADPIAATQASVFFPVGLTKFALLSACTFGLYLVYWFYESWRNVPNRSSGRVHAAFASLFYPLTAYFLFREVERFSGLRGARGRIGAGPLAVCLFLICAAGRMPEPYVLVSLLAFAPILPVARRVNQLNAKLDPRVDPNTRLTAANLAVAAIGGLIVLAAVAGMILAEVS